MGLMDRLAMRATKRRVRPYIQPGEELSCFEVTVDVVSRARFDLALSDRALYVISSGDHAIGRLGFEDVEWACWHREPPDWLEVKPQFTDEGKTAGYGLLGPRRPVGSELFDRFTRAVPPPPD